MRNELIEFVLSRDGADIRDPPALATATVRAVSEVLDELKPLVGDTAARALYLRCLHLARLAFHGPGTPRLETESELLDSLQHDLASREPLDARRAGAALLCSLADLLASLIGEHLTHRMLDTAWGISSIEPPTAPRAEDQSP